MRQRCRTKHGRPAPLCAGYFTVAVRAAEALRELADREYVDVADFLNTLEQNSRVLQQANISHALLFTSQRRIVTEVTEPKPDSVDEAIERLLDVIDDVVTQIETNKADAAAEAATLLDDGDVVLTHENSSTVMATIDAALKDGTYLKVYVTESRPRMLGRRTARQLAGRGRVEATLIVDSAAGHYLPECDHVLFGMNCLVDDTMYNRVGTYPIAVTAADVGVPTTVVAASSKAIGSGFRFENRHRPDSEVMREPVEGFEVGNPAYDATPVRLLDRLVTENGVIEF